MAKFYDMEKQSSFQNSEKTANRVASTLIENGPYQLLNKGPTDRLTRKLSEKLLTLRPIVSCVNTFAYDLSAYLANILSPLTDNSDLMVTRC
jgi:hypothetical protein